MADYRLEWLNAQNAHRWEEFNNRSPEGSFFHSLTWKRIAEKSFGTSSRYSILFDGDEIVGLIPFVDHKIRIFRGLIPLNNPMSLHIVLKDGIDTGAMQYVVHELHNLHRDQKISFTSLSTLRKGAFDAITTYPTFPYGGDGDMLLDLTESPPEKTWDILSSNRRKKMRMFEKDGFEITEARSKDDLLQFYQYYEENLNHIGGTPLPFSHFSEMWDSLSEDIRVTVLSKGSLYAGGMVQLRDKPHKTVYGIYISLNRSLPKKYSPTYNVWWEGVNWAWENNYEKFSFGLEYSNDLNENNPRYLLKESFGGRFRPIYSKLIALTPLFSMGVRCKRMLERREDR